MPSWANQTIPVVQDNFDPVTMRADYHRAAAGDALIVPGPTGSPIFPGTRTLGFAAGISLSTAGDQPILLGSADYILERVWMRWVSGVPVLAAGGIYTAANKGGVALVSALQTYTLLTTINSCLSPTLALPNSSHRTESTLFFNLTVLNVLPAVVDLYIVGIAFDV